MNKVKAIVAFVFIILTGIVSVFAQKTTIYVHEDAEFKTAIELFQKEKFGAAQKSFTNVIKTHRDPQSLIRIDAEFYNAVCAIELFNKDGEFYLKQFITDHPESPKVKGAYFYLGKYNYSKKKYRDANEWFEKVDIYDLETDELAEFYFKRGYSYFSTEKSDLAKKDFYEIKDVDNKYAASAKYYYAHILYNEKNYESALQDFIKLQNNETFKVVVPYYIAQLYYLQGKYDDVISYAPKLLDSITTKRGPEIARIIGESYYYTFRYKEAIPYLKMYEKAVGTLPRKDNYQLGYAYYMVKDYDKALGYFIDVTSVDNDSLAQNAYYHVGDCYLKTNGKQNALNAFGQASKLSFDKAIQEDALFIYARLCYELAYNPYNETIKAFQKYIKDFPKSLRVDEAYTYLVNVFITSKSYKEALEALENITVLTPELQEIYQKVSYYRGVDLFNNSQYTEAIDLLNKAMNYKFNKEISALAMYWIGECYYREKQYMNAIYSLTAYIEEPGAIGTSEFSDANYNIGYSFFQLKDYPNSNLWFRKFVTFKPHADLKKQNDAYNRIGDGYFMGRDFSSAAEYYNESYKIKLVDADYALFQKALSNGVLKKYSSKIADLLTFINAYPKSTYIQKAKFELAQTYLSDGQDQLALSRFKSFMDEYPKSIYINTALSKIGLIYYNAKDDDNALIYFDKLITRDRKSPEANEAINVVKSIYTAKGNVDAMETYLASIGAAIPQVALDTISYGIAKNHYMEQDCNAAVIDFDKYIQKFPDGIFIVSASFYKAECDFKLGNTDGALTGYTNVINKNKNQFTEQSLYRASDILFKKQNYAQAVDLFKQLETLAEDPKNKATAIVGLMRCSYQLKNYTDAISYAGKVASLEKNSNELVHELHYITAQSMMATQRYDEALAEFRAVANTAKSDIGAESFYNIAFIQYIKKDYKQSEKTIFDFVNNEGDHPYWVTKALILLADNYVALGDNFQAKTTLKSITTDSDIPELMKIAQEKIDQITAAEEAAKQPKPQIEPLQLKFEGDSTEQKKLFNEPIQPTPEEIKKQE
ncbi:MAG: tetratricopeptide repeat protein [Bacteroidota bacterium]